MSQPMPPSLVQPRAIVVMGVSGSGKTTLAQLLATQLHCPFIEGDALHDARCIDKMKSGQPLTDDDRWPWLERVGSALRCAADERGIAVAACSALRREYREHLRAAVGGSTLFVMLAVPRAELELRMAQRSGHFMPRSLLASQLATLEIPADHEAALILDATESPGQLCERVMAQVNAAARTANDASG